MKEVKTEQVEQPDPISVAINTPPEKMPQFTVIPTGGVNAFAMCKTIAQIVAKKSHCVLSSVYLKNILWPTKSGHLYSTN